MSALDRAFRHDVVAASLPSAPPDPAGVVTDDDLAKLPDTVQRYLRFMGIVGRSPDWSFRARFSGRFRRTPEESWMACEAWQYDSAPEIARVFTMRILFRRVMPMIGHDTYLRGHGRMLAKLLGVVTVADGRGDEFDTGELTTYLNDVILLAPSMLWRSDTEWTEVDADSFDVALTTSGRTVRARVTVDERGAPVDFSTTDRFVARPGGPVRARWTTPMPTWMRLGGRPHPGPGAATWHLPEGPFTYIEGGFVPGSVTRNEAPPVA